MAMDQNLHMEPHINNGYISITELKFLFTLIDPTKQFDLL